VQRNEKSISANPAGNRRGVPGHGSHADICAILKLLPVATNIGTGKGGDSSMIRAFLLATRSP
jgi:hypothetical protein